ncbi:ATP-binding cassette domain-containing protein [Sulfobacillus sp. hq2]|uniref:ATP-binding cassette domain-containing protein n=1 Tax=Sulfobacillus TaxID=28033 RepID=UPI001FA9413A|nr:ATP-binding cassette domain-containing protein [Sulfobacillus sp. hq2]
MMTSLSRPERQLETPLFAARDLSVRYEGRLALDHVDFTLYKGQSVLVIGPSGSGKSTLAMVVAGLIPDSVEALVTGRVERAPELEASGRIGYIFQDPESQFCQLTAGQEIAFGLENQSVPREEMDGCIRDALSRAHLAVAPDAYNLTLSGGMKQKLAIASALAQNPDVLIFDEPTANLDPQGTAEVFHEIRRLHGSGRTLMVIEHKFLAFMDLLPQVILIGREGTIRAQGPTREVIAREWPWMVQEGMVPPWWTDAHGAWGQPHTLQALAQARRSSKEPDGRDQETLFAARQLRYAYGKRKASREVLHGLDFEIHAGEKVVIVGPNGSGKSTLLALLAGLTKPSGGELDRPQPTEMMPVPVVLGFQNPEHQFVYERVVDELADGYVEDETPPQVGALLQQFGLDGYERHSPFALSQGQKRRLAVAVMLKDDHLAYVLDEPTFGQDARTQEAIVNQLETLHQQGRTVIITTHDMELVARYASRVFVLMEGKIVFDGAPADLFANPALMRQAHLVPELVGEEPVPSETAVDPQTRGWSRFAQVQESQKQSWLGRLNPSVKLIATILAMGIAMFAANIPEAVALAIFPVLLMWWGAQLTLGQIAKRMAPFVIFFVLYTWTLTAYSRVGPHTPVFYFLWYRLSWTGLDNGLILAFRMLASVAFGVLFVSTTDLTDLIVSLSQNLRVPPRFSYGSLAGIRVFPLFEDEWRKIRQARQLRGKAGRYRLTRIVTYALPLLSQAIRMGERVSVAMEARGFRGVVADNPQARTYYRRIPLGWQDGLYVVLVCAVNLAIVIGGH